MNYLNRRANTWVSAAVLAGGFVAALILFWLVKIEAEFHVVITNY